MKSFIIAIAGFFSLVVADNEIVYDCQQTPNICLNFCYYRYCKDGSDYVYGGNGVNSDTNRNLWGWTGGSAISKVFPNGFKKVISVDSNGRGALVDGDTWEEYPYASSSSGGLTTQNWEGTGTVTISLRPAPRTEQSKQGGIIAMSGVSSGPHSSEYQTTLVNVESIYELYKDVNAVAPGYCNPLLGTPLKADCTSDNLQYTSSGSNWKDIVPE